jgi:hypothetical protein
LDIFKIFGAYDSEEFILVVSARSAVNDVLVDRLADDLKTSNIVEISVDTIVQADIEWDR